MASFINILSLEDLWKTSLTLKNFCFKAQCPRLTLKVDIHRVLVVIISFPSKMWHLIIEDRKTLSLVDKKYTNFG